VKAAPTWFLLGIAIALVDCNLNPQPLPPGGSINGGATGGNTAEDAGGAYFNSSSGGGTGFGESGSSSGTLGSPSEPDANWPAIAEAGVGGYSPGSDANSDGTRTEQDGGAADSASVTDASLDASGAQDAAGGAPSDAGAEAPATTEAIPAD
jgi:hypothetical protein